MKNLILTLALAFTVCLALDGFSQLRVVAPNGDVGINEAAPQGTLQITSRGVGSFPLWVANGDNGQRIFQVNHGGVGAGNFFIYDAADVRTIQFAGQGKFYVSSPGNLGIDQNNPSVDFEIGTAAGGGGIAAKPGGGAWAATSDARTKNNVQAYTKGFETLNQIDLVSYEYNGKFGTPTNGKTYTGVIAQDLQKIAPEMVIETTYNSATLEQMESRDYNASNFEEDFLMVDLSNLTYMLINTLKDQQSQIEDLKAQLNNKK